MKRLDPSTTLRISDGVRSYIARHGLCDAKSRVLLAVSGGRDSMVMLSLFCHIGHWPVAVAHCNFGLRGEESDGDEAFVRAECAALGVHCHVQRFDTRAKARETECSIQVAARVLRYTWFEELCVHEGYTCVATAHHTGDLAEGVLLNLARGAGLRGLSGMPVRNGRVIRPLLGTASADLALWAEAMRVPFREDSTNTSDKYARNYVRHHVLPALVRINPQAEMNIAHAAHLAGVAYGELLRLATEQWGGSESFFPWFEACHHGREMLAEWWVGEWLSARGFGYSQIRSLVVALNGGRVGVRVESLRHVAYVGRKGVYLERRSDTKPPVDYREYHLGSEDEVLRVELMSEVPSIEILRAMGRQRHTAYFDAGSLRFPLVLRPWLPGDRIAPLGMRGRKKVSDVLTDDCVAPASRAQVLVLLSGEEVLWIVGMRQSRTASLHQDSSHSVRVELVQKRLLPPVER